jgi:hypothetical protein
MVGRYFGGGTLLAAAADSAFTQRKHQHPHDYLEHGTPHFYGIAGMSHCHFIFSYFEQNYEGLLIIVLFGCCIRCKIPALRHCFAHLKNIGGMRTTQEKCGQLTRYLVQGMRSLKHCRTTSVACSDGDVKGDFDGSLCIIFGKGHNAPAELHDVIQGT